MDVSNAILARSDQLNSVDLAGGPQIVSIVSVKEGNAEQPVQIVTDVFGPGRPFKPSKTVLRVLANVWGSDTTAWVGRRMELYRDPTVRWAGEEVGGIRIKSLSHIDKATVFSLPTSKGKFGKTTVQPLPAAPEKRDTPPTARDWTAELKLAGDDLDALAALGKAASNAHADDSIVDAIRAEFVRARDAQVQG